MPSGLFTKFSIHCYLIQLGILPAIGDNCLSASNPLLPPSSITLVKALGSVNEYKNSTVMNQDINSIQNNNS